MATIHRSGSVGIAVLSYRNWWRLGPVFPFSLTWSPMANILAVDDSPDNLFLLESILDEVAEYQIHCVQDGQSALTLVTESPPDLILLDVMMPGIDGYEVTRRIRHHPTLPYIPILLITAHDESSVVEGLDAGADDFIRKPVDMNELMARVRSLLRLKHSLDEQAAMLRQRDDFVARLTHDLRTPLVAANRVLSLCHQGAFGEAPAGLADAIAKVITNNANLLQMANTLLEVYRHEAGQKALAYSRLSLYELVSEVVQELHPLADEKGLKLHLEPIAADRTDYLIRGDRLELRRVLVNLIGNALKFTDSGHILLRLRPEADNQTKYLCLEVEDSGPGIPESEQASIFEWFKQGEHMRAGSGLGLHLSRRIAEMHAGTLTLKSKPNHGSIFILRLPLETEK
jgi:two-component system sensor histidine kinase/response regulator